MGPLIRSLAYPIHSIHSLGALDLVVADTIAGPLLKTLFY